MIRNTNESVTIADIKIALFLGRPVTIDYENADGVRSVRVVEPFEVVDREQADKRPFFRAMDRLSRDYRTFRFDRLFAYRVSNARGRFSVPRPAPRLVPGPEIQDEISPADLDAEWGDWLESQYDPDAPIPYLPAPYPISER
jgi:predicted DNA-binding transcriptional regulator YafY